MEIVQNPINEEVLNHDPYEHIAKGEKQAVAMRGNDAESFLLKVDHPPRNVPGFMGLPTNDARTQVVPQWINFGINNTPSIYDVTLVTPATRLVTASDLSTFNIAILRPSGARIRGFAFIYNVTTGDMQPDYSNTDIEQNYDFTRFTSDATLYRPAGASGTYALNATYFNNTGIVASTQFNPNILFAGTLLTMSLKEPELFYGFCSSEYTAGRVRVLHKLEDDLLESYEQHGFADYEPRHRAFVKHRQCALKDPRKLRPEQQLMFREYRDHIEYDHYNRTIRQFPTYVLEHLRAKIGTQSDDVLNLDPNTSVQLVNFGACPNDDVFTSFVPSPGQIATFSPRSYNEIAKEGAFITSRLNTVAPKWLTTGTDNSATNGLYICYAHWFDGSGAPHTVPFAENCPPGTTTTFLPLAMDTLWSSDWSWSWTVFQGLTINPNANTSFQLLAKKYVSDYELQASMFSSFAGLAKQGPKPNLAAMQALLEKQYDEPDAKPASANFLGTLVGSGLSLLKGFGKEILGGAVSGAKKKAKTATPTTKRVRELMDGLQLARDALEMPKYKGRASTGLLKGAEGPLPMNARERRKLTGEVKQAEQQAAKQVRILNGTQRRRSSSRRRNRSRSSSRKRNN